MSERGVLVHPDLGGDIFGSLEHWRMMKDLCVLRPLSRLALTVFLNMPKSKAVQSLKVFGIEFSITNLCCVCTNKLKC